MPPNTPKQTRKAGRGKAIEPVRAWSDVSTKENVIARVHFTERAARDSAQDFAQFMQHPYIVIPVLITILPTKKGRK